MRLIFFLLFCSLSYSQGLVNTYQSFPSSSRGDWEDASLIAYWDANDLTEGDGVNVSNWTDQIASYNFSAPSGNEPVVNVRGDSNKEIVFTAANLDYLYADADYAALDLTGPGPYTIIIYFGNQAPGNSQYLVHKGGFSTATQFSLATTSSCCNMDFGIGTTATTVGSSPRNSVPDGFFVARVDSNGKDLIINNSAFLTNGSAGTGTDTQFWRISGRGTGTNSVADMAIRKIAFYSSSLSDTKLTDIYNDRDN